MNSNVKKWIEGAEQVIQEMATEPTLMASPSIPIELHVTEEMLYDLLISFLDYDVPWAAYAKYEWREGVKRDPENPFAALLAIHFTELKGGRQPMTLRTARTMNETVATQLYDGLVIMAKKYPEHFANVILDDHQDAETADFFIQCCLFGEIVYG